MTKNEAMQMALNALEVSTEWDMNATGKQALSIQAIKALRTALAQPKQPMTREQWLDVGLQRGWINRHAFMSQAYTEEE